MVRIGPTGRVVGVAPREGPPRSGGGTRDSSHFTEPPKTPDGDLSTQDSSSGRTPERSEAPSHVSPGLPHSVTGRP